MRIGMTSMFAALLIASMSLVAGCNNEGAAEQYDLVFAAGSEHHTLDPQRMSWMHDNRLANGLFDGLLLVNAETMALEPGAAESWQVSDDQLTYTFKLRPGGKWSNGDPVTSSDFVYAWRRALLPDLAADYTQLLFCIEGGEDFFNWRQQQLQDFDPGDDGQAAAKQLWQEMIDRFDQTVGVEAVDDYTLRVTLKQPTPYFLELVAFSTFMPAHEKSVHGLTRLDPESGLLIQDNFTEPGVMISNGPYFLAGRQFKEWTLLKANPHYWNADAVKSETILEKVISEHQSALLAFQRDEIDWLPDIPTASPLAADLVERGGEEVHVVPAAGTYFYNFNCEPTRPDGSPNPLANAKVRRALSMAIDRKLIVEKVTRMNQPTAKSFVPPESIPSYQPPVNKGLAYSPDAAKKLLAEAGYPNGEGLEGLSILYNTGFGHEDIAVVIKRNWEQVLGVVVTLEGLESRVFGERLKSGDYSIARAAWMGDYRDPTTFLDKFLTGNGNNDAQYSNAEFDQLMAQAATVSNPEARMNVLQRAEAMMLTDQPIAPIMHYVHLHVYEPGRVTGVNPNPWNTIRLDQISVTAE